MDEDNELENNSELTETENTETDNDSGTGEENNSDSENTGTDIPESDNNAEDENNESKKVYFSWNKTFNDETKSQPRRLPESVISDSIDQQKAAIANALGNIEISGVGGGGSDIDFNELKEEIITEVIERLRPSGHVYPDTNLYSKSIRPCVILHSGSANYGKPENVGGVARENGRLPVDFIYELEHMDISKFRSLAWFLGGIFTESYSDLEINLNLSGWDVSNVEDMSCLFANKTFLHDLDLSGWDTRNLRYVGYFLANDNGTYGGVTIGGNLDVSGWDVRNINSFHGFFCNARIKEIDLSTWDLSYASDFDNMFYGSSAGGTSITTKILWGGSCNANLNLSYTKLPPENAELFFQSLDNKMTNNIVTITMPSTAQGADISIATNKGYIIAGITQP